MHLPERNTMIGISFIDIFPKGSINNAIFATHNGSPTTKRQPIIWADDGAVYWYMYESINFE